MIMLLILGASLVFMLAYPRYLATQKWKAEMEQIHEAVSREWERSILR